MLSQEVLQIAQAGAHMLQSVSYFAFEERVVRLPSLCHHSFLPLH